MAADEACTAYDEATHAATIAGRKPGVATALPEGRIRPPRAASRYDDRLLALRKGATARCVTSEV